MKIGDRVTLIDQISPRYLAGAVVEVTDAPTTSRYSGKIISFAFAPPSNASFRVGGSIRFRASHVNEAVQPQQNGKPAPRIILLAVLLEILKANGAVMLNEDDLEHALRERGMTMDTAFTYDATEAL